MKILMFKQEDCAPCKSVEQFLKNELEETPDEVLYLFAGNERANELAGKFGVMQSPTFVSVDENEEMIEMVRGANLGKISALFEERQ